MRGLDRLANFSYVDLEEASAQELLRVIRRIVNEVPSWMASLKKLYSAEERPSIALERLLRELLLQAFYAIRSERKLMEQIALQSLPLVRRKPDELVRHYKQNPGRLLALDRAIRPLVM